MPADVGVHGFWGLKHMAFSTLMNTQLVGWLMLGKPALLAPFHGYLIVVLEVRP